MKAINQLAAGLLLISGILHLYLAIKVTSDPNFVPVLAFGFLYLALGVLLTLNKRFAIWLGLIIPIIPLALSPFMTNFKDTWTIILLAMDVVVVICCLILLLNKNKN
jgi:hypothetical protein